MADQNFSLSLQFTLAAEGGFSDDPNDPGGATMDGITLGEFRTYTGNSGATVDQLKAITTAIRDQIYRDDYWGPAYAAMLPAGVDLSVFDMGVNAGPVTSVKIMQRELAVTPDGIVGSITLAAVARNMPDLIDWLETGQERYYRSLSGFQYFGRGWIARAQARQQAAQALVTMTTMTRPGKAIGEPNS
jgi:lysozyme family protein